MTNKIKSLIGALAIAGAVSAQEEFPFEVALAYQAPVIESTCTNLTEGIWKDSLTNTNWPSVLTGADTEGYLYEPFAGKKAFYKLRSNSSEVAE
jgi:hypothetical protein